MEAYHFSKVFDTTELREHIFAFADNASLANCSQVCSLWTDSALDFLWEEMSDITPLFKILAPMSMQDVSASRYTPIMRQVYVTTVGHTGAWRTFLSYGSRIRHFTLRWGSICDLSDSAIHEVAQKRPSLSITPNLQTLLIHSEGTNDTDVLNFSLLLMHGCIGHLSVRIPYNMATFYAFADHLSLRIPNLQSLELRADYIMSVNDFKDTLVELLPKLRSLRSLRVPYYSLSSEIIRALSASPDLEAITFHDGQAQIVLPTRPNTRFKFPTLKVASFPSLTELQISGSFLHLIPLLSTGCFANRLTSLMLQVLFSESTTSLRVLLDAIMQSVLMLSRLTVDGVPQTLYFNDFQSETMTVSLMTLKPITSMARLVEFSISWPVPFCISNSELESLASELPRIEKLSLNSCPVAIDEKPELTLEVLPKLSRLCPNLRSLALYVDCVAIPSYNASVFETGDSQRGFVPFTNLREIDFGLSHLGRDDHMLSIFLSKVLPIDCVFTYRNSWLLGVEAIVEGKFGELKKNRWSGKYKDIEALTTPLTTARKDERCHAFARIRKLEGRIRELEELKLS